MARALADKPRLVLLSFLMLFVELALIRWTGSNVLYLSYFSNFVLLGSFLGIGIGFLRARAVGDRFPAAPIVLAALIAYVLVFPVEVDRTGADLIYFGAYRRTGLPIWITLPIIFVAVAAVMALIAEGVARTFVLFEPLEAYRLDIVGSILGVAAFSGLSFVRAPPVAWGVMAAAGFAVLLAGRLRAPHVLALIALPAMLLAESLQEPLSWSPYYKVRVTPIHDQLPGPRYRIDVNGVPHQEVLSTEARRRLEPIYFVPYQTATPSDVLIIGAGNGTDVAVALSHGVSRVDAVEIDPRLYEIGRELHPDRPYSDPRVHVVIDDGRAFLERTSRRYDLILFALPDSLTLVAGQSALRLESYLFTVEAMREARAHLRPGGVFAMYNYYREDWLIDRLGATLTEVHGAPPCVVSIGGRGKLALLTTAQAPGATCERATAAPPPVHDDRPFVYLRGRFIPGHYLITIALILALAFGAVRMTAGKLSGVRAYTDLFLMGAAFLLLEAKNVVQFALLFGTTWFVNALVFGGILLSVLAAIEVARRVTFPARVLYPALFAAIAVAFAVPEQSLLGLSFVPRFAAAVALAFAPIFLANLIFAERFKEVEASAVAFGANLLGAMVGGVLEYSALIVGYRALLIVVALLYGAALVAQLRRARAGSGAAAAVYE